ncbi:hypothetical protein CY34DRAFT_810708 [Suillus luteus UH-Slu-Lm8-n1]|uniref:Uncharacterized protein n=1 Tax=Suillus luteus UH-Slu-Lm8-n1 TaxID=930992 RepID=A0A0D0AS49_9AGAM|nr:hypothetical protein CY34DRAFT_810708 [Suillus luteus UH-Slu-Lm8-n1]
MLASVSRDKGRAQRSTLNASQEYVTSRRRSHGLHIDKGGRFEIGFGTNNNFEGSRKRD